MSASPSPNDYRVCCLSVKADGSLVCMMCVSGPNFGSVGSHVFTKLDVERILDFVDTARLGESRDYEWSHLVEPKAYVTKIEYEAGNYLAIVSPNADVLLGVEIELFRQVAGSAGKRVRGPRCNCDDGLAVTAKASN